MMRTFSTVSMVCVLAGNNSFTVKCEDSTDGKTWTPTFEGQWTKSR